MNNNVYHYYIKKFIRPYFSTLSAITICACLSFFTATAFAQQADGQVRLNPEKRVTIDAVAFPQQPQALQTCPMPLNTRVDATDYSILEDDMHPRWTTGNGLNGTSINTFYAHTFRWETQQDDCTCCQITRAVMSVTFEALFPGNSQTSSDAGNDSFHITSSGGTIVQSGISGTGRVWTTWPFNTGNTITKTVVITNQAILNSGHLSFFVEDDTAITAASLTIQGCCVNQYNPRGCRPDDPVSKIGEPVK